MNRTAVYAGSFDPATNGHLDIIRRAASFFERLIVAVAVNTPKQPLFSVEERMEMLRAVCRDLPGAEIARLEGLTVEFARRKGATTLVRGLRAVSDFEFELQQATLNRKLDPQIETVFLMTSPEFHYLNSSIVKEIAELGGAVGDFVPPEVEARLREKSVRGGKRKGGD